MMSDVSAYGNDLEFVCVCLDFPEFFEFVDVCNGSICGDSTVIFIERMGYDL